MDYSDDDLTADGIDRIISSKEAVAKLFKDNRSHCREAWIACGFAVELAVKKRIMRQNGYNTWPSKEMRNDLHIHDLRRLMEIAGIDLKSSPRHMRPALRLVLDWSRGHDYVAARMPRRIANDIFTAAFGEKGVVAWIDSLPLAP